MTNAGVFLVGFAITIVVLIAGGILSYGITLENRDLVAEAAAAASGPQPVSNEDPAPAAPVLDLHKEADGRATPLPAHPLPAAADFSPRAA